MFRGATKITIDDKGRVVVPVRYRGLLSAAGEGRVVVTVDRDECLLIYSAPEWERIEQQLNSLPSLHPQVRRLQRLMIGHAEELLLDSHGRLALTPELREFAGSRVRPGWWARASVSNCGMRRAGTSSARNGRRVSRA